MLEHMLGTHAHVCLVPKAMLLQTIPTQFPKQLQQLLQAMASIGQPEVPSNFSCLGHQDQHPGIEGQHKILLGSGKDKRASSPRAKINPCSLTSEMYYNTSMEFFEQSTFGLQPFSWATFGNTVQAGEHVASHEAQALRSTDS